MSSSIVLFSGGRDSSLAACYEARDGYEPTLFTALTGGTIESTIVTTRVEELAAAFPDVPIRWVQRRCSGIFRRIAIADIEDDFRRYGTNLILLGHQLAVQTEAVVLARQLGITRLVNGFAGYQANTYMEQSDEAIATFRAFLENFDIELCTPILHFQDLDTVKFELLDFGVTTKSLESVSLFADSFSAPRPGAVEEYLQSKIEIASDYVRTRLGS